VIFETRQSVEVNLVPGDFVIIVSDSASLKPSPFNTWGSSVSWPASEYFNFSLAPLADIETGEQKYTSTQWQELNFRRWATQQCFNPIFSPIKIGAALLAERLQKIKSNKVGLLFSPGSIINSSAEEVFLPNYSDKQHGENKNIWFANTPISW